MALVNDRTTFRDIMRKGTYIHREILNDSKKKTIYKLTLLIVPVLLHRYINRKCNVDYNSRIHRTFLLNSVDDLCSIQFPPNSHFRGKFFLFSFSPKLQRLC